MRDAEAGKGNFARGGWSSPHGSRCRSTQGRQKLSPRRKTTARRARLRRRNNEGSVTERSDGRWQIAFSVKGSDGKPQRIFKYAPTEEEAEQVRTELAYRHATGDLTMGDATTFAVLAQRWLNMRKESVRPNTHCSYQYILDAHTLPGIGDVTLRKLTRAHVEDLLVSLGRKGLGLRSKRYVLWLVQAVLRYAVEHGLITKNAAASLRLKDSSRSGRRLVWTADEAARFVESAREDRVGIAFQLMLACGLRRGEVLGLKWAAVDLDRACMSIEATLCKAVGGGVEFGEPKTSAGRRQVYLASDLVQALAAQKERQAQEQNASVGLWSDHDLVVCTQVGTPMHPDNLKRVLKRLCKQAGVPLIRVHDLRHTHASLSLQCRVDDKVLSERLGHTNVAFTRSVYQHTYEQQHRMAALPLATLTGEREGP